MKKIIIAVILIMLSSSLLFAKTRLFEDHQLKVAFHYSDKWEIADNKDGNIKLTVRKGGDFPFIGVTITEETTPVDTQVLRDFYLKADKNLDAQYKIQFLNFKKEHAKLVWMNGNLALYYQFKFSDAKGGKYFGKQVLGATGKARYTILLAVKEGEFNNYNQEFDLVIESFFGFSYLGISEKGIRNYIDAQRAYYSNDYSKAEKLFNKVIKSDGEFCEPYFFKGLSIQGASGYERIQESSALFGQAVMKNQDHFIAMNQVALCWAAVSNPQTEEGVANLKKAFKVLDDAINVNSYSEETLLNKASLLINIGNYDLGLQFLDRILELNPRNEDAKEIKNKLVLKINELKKKK